MSLSWLYPPIVPPPWMDRNLEDEGYDSEIAQASANAALWQLEEEDAPIDDLIRIQRRKRKENAQNAGKLLFGSKIFGKKVYTGPRGGRYIIRKGRKKYL